MKGGYTDKSVQMQYGWKKANVTHNVWVVASREATTGNSSLAMCWQVVMGCSRMRMLRPGGCTARHSAALLRHHSCVQDAASALSIQACIAIRS